MQVLVEALEMARGATQSNAAAAVGNLAHDHSDNKARIAAEPGALAALVSALRRGSDDCRFIISCVYYSYECMHVHCSRAGRAGGARVGAAARQRRLQVVCVYAHACAYRWVYYFIGLL